MNRRTFMTSAAAASLACGAPVLLRAAPAPFRPTRFTSLVKGSGRDVILIPGLTASRDIWNGTVAALPGHRFHLLQVNGFAGTPAAGNAAGAVLAPLAAEIAAYIAANGLARPALVGHSMGGTLAMMVAARHPLRVGKVVVVDMLPQPAGLIGSSTTNVRGLAESLRGITATPGGRELVASLMGMFGNPATARTRSDPDVVARATHELALTDLSPELPKITAPLTVVYAVPDAENRARIEASYQAGYAPAKAARLVRIDGSGHMIMYDQPAKFRVALKAALD
jgi:pimeloyl-ACP methyl ester carboxylesterase